MTALLQVQQLQKRFGPRLLLNIDELRIDCGHAYVLTGMNGAGKSMLLRILAGLETAHIGAASLHGVPVTLQPYAAALRLAMGYVHQHPVMFAGTVEYNVGYGLRARGGLFQPRQAQQVQPTQPTQPTQHQQIIEAMQWAGILHLRHSPARQLSGGEKQRVALARAKVLQPQCWLLDEPTANLDGQAREQVLALIPDLIRDGRSLLMVCHDRDLIRRADIVHWKLRDGLLQYK